MRPSTEGAAFRRGPHLKVPPLLEREAVRPLLLAPAAPLIGVAHDGVLVPVGIETWVQVESKVILPAADIDGKAVGLRAGAGLRVRLTADISQEKG